MQVSVLQVCIIFDGSEQLMSLSQQYIFSVYMFAVTIEPEEASQNGHCFFSLEVCLSCTVKLEFLNTPENVLLD